MQHANTDMNSALSLFNSTCGTLKELQNYFKKIIKNNNILL